jgi:septal ring factor EnvC (AmiA/AmiB activator)
MKTIKKYWAIIAGAILAFIAIIFASDKINKKKISKIDKKIDDNNQQIDVIQGKTEVIDDQRNDVKQNIKDTKQDIASLQAAKETITPAELPVDKAKQNILNKTRRGRKSKK